MAAMTKDPQPYRVRYWGVRHAASAGHYLAAQAAFQVLESGGNAIDAGVAGGIALGVVESLMVGFAGVAPILIYLADKNEVVSVSGVGPHPRLATCDYFRKHHNGLMDGIMQTVVPGAPDAWFTCLERFGTMSFAEVVAASIRYARDGFVMYPLMAENIQNRVALFSQDAPTAAIYLPGGRPPAVGEIFYQKDLAKTLQFLADEETAGAKKGGRAAGLAAARRAFYQGDIATAIERHQKEKGGLLRVEDMAGFRAEVEPPCHVRFGATDVYSVGPWGQGPGMLEALNILSGFDLKALGHNSVPYIHAVIEAIKLAMADREVYFGDPKFVDVPIDALLSAAHADARRKMIRPDQAWAEMPPAGKVPGGKWPSPTSATAGSVARAPAGGVDVFANDTSYVCVIDRHGNTFSGTPSDGNGGAPIVPGMGISPSTRGKGSRTDPKHTAHVAPGRRPRMTNGPVLALGGKRWILPLGTPGSDNQLQANLQVLLNVFVFGMDPQDAVEAPRFNTHSFPQTLIANPPHDYQPGSLWLESRIARESGEALARMGHKVGWWPAWGPDAGHMDVATVCTILADREKGVLKAAHDPRRVSGAVAV